MGQSPSTSRHDNASTRTLHSTSMNSNTRRLTFFQRISNRLSTTHHSSRRFGRASTLRTTAARTPIIRTSSSSVTSSVRRATQEATRDAAAVTGPPNFLLQQQQQQQPEPEEEEPQPQQEQEQGSNRNRNSTTSSTVESFWNELLLSDDNGVHSILQIPLRVQQEINARLNSDTSSTSSTAAARRMRILLFEFRPNNDNTSAATRIPTSYRFLGLRRQRSQVSTTSSTDTIQSLALSMQSNTRTANNSNVGVRGQWFVYLVSNNYNNGSMNEDNPSYEELLWLSNMLGNVRSNTTTQQAVDEAIPVIDWSNDLKDDSCLVCLDEFTLKQSVRILKCHHIFHRECVDRWLCEAHNSCPVCRDVPV